jgi:hypothetical protein
MWLNWLSLMATTLSITHVSIGVEKTVCQTGKGSDPLFEYNCLCIQVNLYGIKFFYTEEDQNPIPDEFFFRGRFNQRLIDFSSEK